MSDNDSDDDFTDPSKITVAECNKPDALDSDSDADADLVVAVAKPAKARESASHNPEFDETMRLVNKRKKDKEAAERKKAEEELEDEASEDEESKTLRAGALEFCEKVADSDDDVEESEGEGFLAWVPPFKPFETADSGILKESSTGFLNGKRVSSSTTSLLQSAGTAIFHEDDDVSMNALEHVQGVLERGKAKESWELVQSFALKSLCDIGVPLEKMGKELRERMGVPPPTIDYALEEDIHVLVASSSSGTWQKGNLRGKSNKRRHGAFEDSDTQDVLLAQSEARRHRVDIAGETMDVEIPSAFVKGAKGIKVGEDEDGDDLYEDDCCSAQVKRALPRLFLLIQTLFKTGKVSSQEHFLGWLLLLARLQIDPRVADFPDDALNPALTTMRAATLAEALTACLDAVMEAVTAECWANGLAARASEMLCSTAFTSKETPRLSFAQSGFPKSELAKAICRQMSLTMFRRLTSQLPPAPATPQPADSNSAQPAGSHANHSSSNAGPTAMTDGVEADGGASLGDQNSQAMQTASDQLRPSEVLERLRRATVKRSSGGRRGHTATVGVGDVDIGAAFVHQAIGYLNRIIADDDFDAACKESKDEQEARTALSQLLSKWERSFKGNSNHTSVMGAHWELQQAVDGVDAGDAHRPQAQRWLSGLPSSGLQGDSQ